MNDSAGTIPEQTTLDFDLLVEEVSALIEKHPVMILATSAGDRVTARSMSIIHDGLKIYFQTGCDSDKYAQLIANPQVALCADNIQIEGRAADLGHPLSPACEFFASAYSVRHPGSFHTYSALSTNRVIDVTPTRIVLWKYDPNGKPYRDFLDLQNHLAWREIYPLNV